MDREERQEALEELRKKAAAVAEPIHEMLLQDIVRRVRGTGAITSTAEYQIYRAEQLGLAEKEIKRAISEQLQVSDTVIDALFEDMADLTAEFEDNGQLRQLVEAYSTVSRRAAAEDFDDLWAPGPDGKLYTVKEAYGKIMDFAYMQAATGALDYQTAIRRSLKELLQRGIRTIPRGNGHSMRIEFAVRQYVINRMGEMHNAISQMNYETIGADGWEISAHAAPRRIMRLIRDTSTLQRNMSRSTAVWTENLVGGAVCTLCILFCWVSAHRLTVISSCSVIWMRMKQASPTRASTTPCMRQRPANGNWKACSPQKNTM